MTGAGPAPDGPALDARRLAATLRDGDRRFTLDARDLRVAPGEAVALEGPSGAGKTLLLEMAGLLRAPDAGSDLRVAAAGGGNLAALWDGAAGRARLPEIRGRAFGFVPQAGGLLPFLDVAANVRLSQEIAGRPDPGLAERLIARLGLAGVAGLRPGPLSRGQRQRVAIARALSHRPAVVIADEPTAALDPEGAAAVMGLLLDAARVGGAALLLSCHDAGLVARFGLAVRRLEPEPAEPGTARSRLAGAARRPGPVPDPVPGPVADPVPRPAGEAAA